ncbi:MAG: ethanolamine ammonia-lyase subunit EutC [Caldisericota bacterium]|jgi:ethanolamine ammonia-lyase small subunit|nr:ethanolamine ammonia-lyase subunit EutC [Caldisericota bacterium]
MSELKAFERGTIGVKNPYSRETLEALTRSTAARICVGREGSRPPVDAWLAFRLDEATAKDAIWNRVPDEFLKKNGLDIRVATVCTDKREYLAHPEKGGILTKEAEETLLAKCKKGARVQVFVSEGLSSMAIEENIPDLLPALKHGFEAAGITMGTPFYVDNGRVRLLNDVCRVLQPEVAIMLIGERPGLVTQTSLSAYSAYSAKMTDTDGERNCISNIYSKGLNPMEAAATIVDMTKRMLDQKVSGVALKL